jgi:phage baseplate assembly protein gpV
MTLLETIQKIIREELGQIRTSELAIVQAQHPHASDSDQDNYACTVKLRNSEIVLKQVPVATPRIGTVSIPAVGDLVLVNFINGDINAPIITNSLYNDVDRPPVNEAGQAIWHLPLGAGDSDAVHAELHSGDRRELTLQLGDGISINIRDDDPVIELTVDSGKASIKIDRDGAITLKSSSSIQIEGSSDINIKAGGQLNLKGATINLN